MAEKIREVMSTKVVTLDATASPTEAARAMRENDIGALVVERDDRVCGILTDRDLVVRCLADEDGLDQEVGDLCSEELTSVAPDADVGEAIRLMSDRAIRRIPVVENGHAVGIVSIGDLAQARDPESALGQISAAPPNR